MKRIVFIMVFFFAYLFLQAQKKEVEQKLNSDQNLQVPTASYIYTKAGGDVIWEEDFEAIDWAASIDANTNLLLNPDLLPEGWAVSDNTGHNFYWHWSLLGPRGRYTDNDMDDPCSPSEYIIHSNFFANGFMMLESDYFNSTAECTMINPPIQMDSYIMTPSLNFSGSPGAVLKWQQLFRYCCIPYARFIVSVSTDYDENNPSLAHWIDFDAFFGSPQNQMSENPQNAKIDLTNYVAGQSNVRIRWHQTSGSHYFWIIDDIIITEPYAYDLVLTSPFASYLNVVPSVNFENDKPGGYCYIPKNQLGAYKEFRAVIANQGYNIQNNVHLNLEVIKNDIVDYPLWEVTSEAGSVNFGLSDTFKILTDYMIPEKIGKYSFIFEAVSQQMDYNLDDNSDGIDVFVTDSIYSRSRLDLNDFSEFTTGYWIGGDYDGAMVGVLYSFPHDAVLNGINFYFSKRNDSIMVQNGDFSCRCHIYEANSEGFVNPQALYISPIYILQPGDRGNFVSLPFSDTSGFAISTGKYYAVLEFFTNSEDGNNHVDFYIGQDKGLNNCIYDDGFPITIFKSIDVGWGYIRSTPAIYLNIAGTKTPMTKVVFMVQMDLASDDCSEFVSGRDSVLLLGSFNGFGQSKEYMSPFYSTIYSLTKYIPRGDTFQWEYAFQTPDGTRHYEQNIHYMRTADANYSSMTIIDNFNNIHGDCIEISEISVQDKIQFFPNPANEFLNVSNLLGNSKIFIYNTMGSMVYCKEVSEKQPVINLEGLVTGIYFVKVKDEMGNHTLHRFVKQ